MPSAVPEPEPVQAAIIRQLGPWAGHQAAVGGVHGEGIPAGRPGAVAERVRLGQRRELPAVQPAQAHWEGVPPSRADRCATAVANAARITCGAVRRGPPGAVNAALPGSCRVQVSSTSSRLAWSGVIFSPPGSRCTGTAAVCHQGWNTAVR